MDLLALGDRDHHALRLLVNNGEAGDHALIADALDRHRDEERRCEEVLADPALEELPEEQPDVTALAREHDELRERVHRLRSAHQAAKSRLERLEGLRSELEALLVAWRPVREEHRTVADLSSFAEGRSVDNRLQMRLSAYVLGGLPPAFLLYLVVANHAYVSVLFTTPLGIAMLVGGAMILSVGIFWMSRVVKVEV